MRDKLNQFILDIQGQFVEVSDRINIYQCMDLAFLWVLCLGYPKATIRHLFAYQVYTEPTDLTRQYFDLIPNTPDFIPQDGDITVFTGGTAGHIGIALGGGTISTFNNFEQNWPIGTNASVRARNYNTPKLIGVLRPKVFPTLTVTDQTKIPQIGNMEVQAIRGIIGDKDKLITDQSNKLQQIHSISG